MAYTGTVEIKGLAEMVDKVQGLEREMRRDANTALRQGSKDISLSVVSNRHSLLGGGGPPQEWGIVDGARVKYDRYVAVQVPGRKPVGQTKGTMRGLIKTPAARAKSLAVAVEWGSDDPRLKGPPRGAIVGRNVGRLTRYVRDDYASLVAYVLRRYGLL
jgi:hypothetical protein